MHAKVGPNLLAMNTRPQWGGTKNEKKEKSEQKKPQHPERLDTVRRSEVVAPSLRRSVSRKKDNRTQQKPTQKQRRKHRQNLKIKSEKK